MSNPYYDILNAEVGSPEHMEALAQIQSRERAEAKTQDNMIKGTGVSGHPYASHTIVPDDAVPGFEMSTPGAMKHGQSSPDMREGIIRIGDMETSTEVGEAMRRGMTPAEWTALTGLPYVSLTQVQHVHPDEGAKAAAKLAPVQEQLDEANELEAMIKANEVRISRISGGDFTRSWARVSRHCGQPFRGSVRVWPTVA